MRLINSSVEIIPQDSGLLGIYKQIELGGRTAYKSEDKITQNSAESFVSMLIDRGHTAPLEQGTVYLKIPNKTCDGPLGFTNALIGDYNKNPYSVVKYDSDYIYITTNARVIYENNWKSDLIYLCDSTDKHEKRITARFICSRSIGNELVRHRAFNNARGLF